LQIAFQNGESVALACACRVISCDFTYLLLKTPEFHYKGLIHLLHVSKTQSSMRLRLAQSLPFNQVCLLIIYPHCLPL
jgi:hypothetical protein